MTQQSYDEVQDNDEQAIIPPGLLLGVAGLALVAALAVSLVNGALGVGGWAALAISLLSLVLLVVLAPGRVVGALTGRTLRFGGTSILFTLIFLAVLVVLYWFVGQQNWEVDVSQTNEFSLSTSNRQVLTTYAADPTLPEIEVLGFYSADQTDRRERVEALLEDYEAVSGGKISYRFIDPDRNPQLAALYNLPEQFNQARQFGGSPSVLVVRDPSVEEPDAAEIVDTSAGFEQAALTNTILQVSTPGDFRAYFLSVEEGLSIADTSPAGLGNLSGRLQNVFGWTVEEVSLFQLAATESEFTLLEPGADGEVLIVPGGAQALAEPEAEFLVDYLEQGGDVILMAAPDIEQAALASTETLNTYLVENFGLSFGSGVILDQQQSFQSADFIVVDSLSSANFITQNVPPNAVLVAPFSRPIELAEVVPTDVQVFDLAQSSQASYLKSVEELLQNEDFQATEEDPAGPFTVLAAAENTQTGGSVVLFGSYGTATNQFDQFQEAANSQIVQNSLVWATDFDEFVQEIPQVTNLDLTPADAPVVADNQQLNLISFVSLFLLPFGVLAIGGLVWSLRRR